MACIGRIVPSSLRQHSFLVWNYSRLNQSGEISIWELLIVFSVYVTKPHHSCTCVDDTGYCTPAEEVQAEWPKQVENLRLDDDQEFPAVTRLYTQCFIMESQAFCATCRVFRLQHCVHTLCLKNQPFSCLCCVGNIALQPSKQKEILIRITDCLVYNTAVM